MEPAATLRIDAHRVTRGLFAAIGVLTLLHAVTLVLRYGLDEPFLYGLVPMFDTDHEKNVPTYYSAIVMLWCAHLLALTALLERRRGSAAFPGWMLLTVIFVLLPFDELFELHERIGRAVHAALNTSGVFGYAWVIPYGLLTIVGAWMLLRLLAQAPPDTRRRLIVAGAVYVGGAIGFEMLGALILDRSGAEKTLPYALCATVEELLEMCGIALLARALLLHLARLEVGVRIAAQASGTFSSSASQAAASPSLGARQSPRGESEPPEPTFGAFGTQERLN